MHRLFRLWAQGGRGACSSSPKRVRGLWRELQKSLPPAMPAAKKGKNLGLEPCSGCRSKTGCLLESAKRPLSEVKTAGLSPPRQRAKQRAHVPARASGLRAHFIRAVIAVCVIGCAAAAGGIARHLPETPIEAGTESFLQQQARRKAIDRESRLVRAELELAQQRQEPAAWAHPSPAGLLDELLVRLHLSFIFCLFAIHPMLFCRHNHMEETQGEHWCHTQTTSARAAARWTASQRTTAATR